MALKHASQLWIAALVLLTACSTSPLPRSKAELTAPPVSQEILTSIPFTLHDNRITVNVFLNGQGPFVMVFDTGSANTLTPEVQKVLDLKSQGEEYVAGAGEKRASMHSVHLKSLQVGDFKLSDQKFMVVNMAPIRRAFRFPHLDGIIGLEILQQAKVRIDMDRQVIDLVRMDAPAMKDAQTLKFELVDDNPIVQGKIDGQPARILLDTGDRSNLTLFRKFAHQSKLDALFNHRESMVTGVGLSGPIRGKLASVQKVELGPAEVSDVLVRLPLTKRGYFYSNQISASAGMGLLKGFNMEFDYKNKVVALQRRKDFKETSTFVPVNARAY